MSKSHEHTLFVPDTNCLCENYPAGKCAAWNIYWFYCTCHWPVMESWKVKQLARKNILWQPFKHVHTSVDTHHQVRALGMTLVYMYTVYAIWSVWCGGVEDVTTPGIDHVINAGIIHPDSQTDYSCECLSPPHSPCFITAQWLWCQWHLGGVDLIDSIQAALSN